MTGGVEHRWRRVRLPGIDVNENGDATLETVVGLADETVGVDVWRDGRAHATVWRIPTQ
jgi:hypothetical protein